MKPNEALDIVGCLAWHNLRPSTEEIEEAIEIIDEALEKQTPMKPMQPEVDIHDGVIIPCGYCGGDLQRIHNYCPWCGQKIDWSKNGD